MDSNLSVIPPYVHLFFDDDKGNIDDVQSVAKSKSINLQSVHCPPGPISFYDAEGTQKITNYADYSALKQQDDTISAHFKQFIKSTDRMSVGRGITPDMIGQIIAYEEKPQSRLYFFDFDLLLSQLGGLDFSFVQNRDHVNMSYLNDYAKYLFSDCIGEESPTGRLNLLKQMFSAIGPDRVYIITSNAFANPNSNPFLKFFLGLTQVLLPSFHEHHLICTNSKIANPLFTKKSDAIMFVFNNVFNNAFKKSFMPLPSSTDLPSSTALPSSLPSSLPRSRNYARPPSALKYTIAKPKIKTTIYKKRKGGARRRSKFLHTRKKIRIT